MNKDKSENTRANMDDLLETNAYIHDFSYDVRRIGEGPLSGDNEHDRQSYPQKEQKNEFRKYYDDKLRREAAEYQRGVLSSGVDPADISTTNPYIDPVLTEKQDTIDTIQSLMGGNIEYGGKDAGKVRRVQPKKTLVNIQSKDRNKTRWQYPNEYEVKFKSALRNIKEIRLVTTEIPNTEQTIREYPEEKRNNIVRWENKEDKSGAIQCIYCIINDVDTYKSTFEVFVKSEEYYNLLDRFIDPKNPVPTKIMIKNCSMKPNGVEFKVPTATGISYKIGKDLHNIEWLTHSITNMTSFQIDFDWTDFLNTSTYMYWEYNDGAWEIKYRPLIEAPKSLIQGWMNDVFKSVHSINPNLVKYNNDKKRWSFDFSNMEYTYFKNNNPEFIATYCGETIETLAISTNGEFYISDEYGSFERNSYVTYVKPGYYLSDSIKTELESVTNVDTIHGDKNIQTYELDLDRDITTVTSYKKLKVDDNFGIIKKLDSTEHVFSYTDFSNRRIITDFIIIRCKNHGLKKQDKIKLNEFYTSLYGIPSSFTNGDHYVELLSVYKGSDNNLYLMLYDKDEYRLPKIKLNDFDSGKYLNPITENYFLIRTNGYIPNITSGILTTDLLDTLNDGIDDGETELYKYRPFKLINSGNDTVSNKLGYSNVDSFDRVTKQIEEITNYYYESYYTQSRNQKLAIGVKVRVRNHNLVDGDLVEISGSNCEPSIDGKNWSIRILNNDYFLILFNSINNNYHKLFYEYNQKMRHIIPFFVNRTSNPNAKIKLVRDDGFGGYIDVAECVSFMPFAQNIRESMDPRIRSQPTKDPFIKNIYVVPDYIEIELDRVITNEFLLYLQSDDYDINDNYDDNSRTRLTVPISFVDLDINIYYDYKRIRINIYSSTKEIIVNYKTCVQLEISNLNYSNDYERDDNNVIWNKNDFYILKQNGNRGLLNPNPVIIWNSESDDRYYGVEINHYGNSFSVGEKIYITGFENNSNMFIDKYAGYYTIYRKPYLQSFFIKIPRFIQTKDLQHLLIFSKYSGFREQHNNLDGYDRVQGVISLDGDPYILMTNDKFDAIENTGPVDNVLAKIKMTGAPGGVLYDTFITNPIIFEDSPYPEITSMKFRFVRPDGTLFNFNKQDHSFTLEFIEHVDKLEGTDQSSVRGVSDNTTQSKNTI